jgi:hypothetical protein
VAALWAVHTAGPSPACTLIVSAEAAVGDLLRTPRLGLSLVVAQF